METDLKVEEKNKDFVYREYYDNMQRNFLKTLICDEIIEEHKNKPLGQHSEPLSRLLHFFSSAPQKNKYALKKDEVSNNYVMIALSGERGEPPKVIEDKTYKTLQEAYHGVFLKRIEDLMQT